MKERFAVLTRGSLYRNKKGDRKYENGLRKMEKTADWPVEEVESETRG